ncbi:hypothetical protein TrVE_jg6511 [Triparma verrucosa]|uniref:Spp2/MOS2 G-patch domain-containing protein n=1 Tax=Triparma verrucosa TaxID=1606542 RepID=A0A9W7EJJ6_9STRA|nr:hypothetical protein TrVE_jg6511 [Triparma verrucosa]
MPLIKLKAKKTKTLAPSSLGDEGAASTRPSSNGPLSIPVTASAPSSSSSSTSTTNVSNTLQRAKELAEGIKNDANGPAHTIAMVGGRSSLLSHHASSTSSEAPKSDADKYKDHLEQCPEEATVEDECYSAVKVDDFGAAMLRGMGWNPNKKEEKSAVVVKARPQRLGLGAKQVAGVNAEKEERRKNYEQKRDITRTAPSAPAPPPPPPPPATAKPEDTSGGSKGKRKASEMYVPSKGSYVIVNGKDVCLVQNVNANTGMVYVEIVATKEEKAVGMGKCEPYEKKEKKTKKGKKTWLLENIVVKLIGDKKSKYYKCKGVVTSLDPPRLLLLSPSSFSGVSLEVNDRDLETCVKIDKPCLGLKGEYKNIRGIVKAKKGDDAIVEFEGGGRRGEVRIELDYVAQLYEK